MNEGLKIILFISVAVVLFPWMAIGIAEYVSWVWDFAK